jgi:hypothetical protein
MPHQALLDKLAHDSRRSALIGFVGGAVIVASFAGFYVSVIDYRKSNTTLNSNLTITQATAASEKQKAQTSSQQAQAETSVIQTAVKTLESTHSAASVTTSAALDKALDANPTAAALLVRVYIHTNTVDQKKRAMALASALRADGYIVPGIDQLPSVYAQGPKTYTTTEIHYYTADNLSFADVAAIAKAVEAVGITVKTVQVAPSMTNKVRPRAYGLYLARSLQ